MTEQVNLEPTKLASAINKEIMPEIDISGDEDIMTGEIYDWDDLVKLKNEIQDSTLDFIGQVSSVVTNEELMSNIGERYEELAQTVKIFSDDMEEFSGKIGNLYESHKDQSGKVTDLDQLNDYNRKAMTYHSLFGELGQLVPPTLGKIMSIVNDTIGDLELKVEELNVDLTEGVEDVE